PVTLTVREHVAVPAVASSPTRRSSDLSGMLKIDQLVPLIDDPSNAPVLVIQVTDGAPLPPVTVPESEIAAEVVVAEEALIVSASGRGGGASSRVTLTMRETLPVASAAV